MKPFTVALVAAGLLVASLAGATLGAIATIHFVATPLVERNLWFEREMLHSQVDALQGLQAGSSRQAVDVLRARSFYALSMLTADPEQTQKTRSSPQLLEAAKRVCTSLADFEADPIATGNQKKLAREACAALR